jgi:hypothetical protein
VSLRRRAPRSVRCWSLVLDDQLVRQLDQVDTADRALHRRAAFTHPQAGTSLCADAAPASNPIPARRPAKTAGAPFHVGRA